MSIFFVNICPFLAKKDQRRKKLKKLYDTGYHKIKENLDIVKIMKDLSNIKIVMEHSLMTNEIKSALQHQKENVIFIDSEDEFKPGDEENEESVSSFSSSRDL